MGTPLPLSVRQVTAIANVKKGLRESDLVFRDVSMLFMFFYRLFFISKYLARLSCMGSHDSFTDL